MQRALRDIRVGAMPMWMLSMMKLHVLSSICRLSRRLRILRRIVSLVAYRTSNRMSAQGRWRSLSIQLVRECFYNPANDGQKPPIAEEWLDVPKDKVGC